VIRIAAVGDVHAGPDSVGTIGPRLGELSDVADVLLLAGDLTKSGDPGEAQVLAEELRDLDLPIVAVLGNHDHHADHPQEVAEILTQAGIEVLEGSTTVLELDGGRLGVVGAKGFAGGFEGGSATAFGEPEMKAFVDHTKERAAAVDRALARLNAEVRVLLLHYSPVRDTLQGEPSELYPFLGSYLFAEVADRHDVVLVLHGHAHAGTEKGNTPAGIPVRNVAMPVIRRAYAVYALQEGRLEATGTPESGSRPDDVHRAVFAPEGSREHTGPWMRARR
jgi:Icc-related predicted phosphoesterase